MNLSQVRLLLEHNAWADARILAACAKVTPKQYAAPNPLGPGRGGLRETMVQILDNIRQQRITLQGLLHRISALSLDIRFVLNII